jgi:hypothetical protein
MLAASQFRMPDWAELAVDCSEESLSRRALPRWSHDTDLRSLRKGKG